jgi:hypothetical protein
MAKKKSSKSVSDADIDAILDDPPFAATNLNAVQQAFLIRTCRFLVNVHTPGYADKARREGYTSDEHALGWRLWRTAAGETRSFDQWLSEQQLADGIGSDDAEQQQLLGAADLFENTWFPRTRAIIRRVVPRERRDGFAAAFFKDLKQQPLGPAVVGSVTTFITRVEDLDKSTDKDAKAVRAMLRSRGLTKGKIDAVKEQLERVRVGLTPNKPKAQVSAADLEKAKQTQLEAFEDLRDWFNDWGTTLRSRFGARDQIRLGLAVARGSGSAEDVESEEEVVDIEAEGGATQPATSPTGSTTITADTT